MEIDQTFCCKDGWAGILNEQGGEAVEQSVPGFK
jgi:hypothetical protein